MRAALYLAILNDTVMKLLLVPVLIILIHSRSVDSSTVHYITPSLTTHQCPGKSCLTLATLAAVNSRRYFDSNTTLVFLEGDHGILGPSLILSNINGTLLLTTNGSGTAAISGHANFEFSHITQLRISGLEFNDCSISVKHVNQFILEDSSFYGGSTDSVLCLNSTNTSIVQSSFVSNTAGTYGNHVRILEYIRVNRYRLPHSGHINSWSTSAKLRVGGALFITSSTVSINTSHFESNTAMVGGAIFVQLGSKIDISNSTFFNNSATNCSAQLGCLGGAIFIDSGCTVTTLAYGSTFMNNTAIYGGAIALFQGTFLDSAHNVFSNNRASEFGGAITAIDRSRITIENSCYSNNVGNNGGALYAFGSSNITVCNSLFYANEAGKGGVMSAQFSSKGGVMSAQFSSTINVSDSSFDNNEAGEGGVIHTTYYSNTTVSNSSFNGNKAYLGGVMSALERSSVTVSNSIFSNNEAYGHGGVISVRRIPNLTVNNCSFDNNEAGNDGGVLYVYYDSSAAVKNSSFDNNTASSDGGAMHIELWSSLTVDKSSFNKNAAGNDGGAICAFDIISSTVCNYCSFDNNEAGNDGGALAARSSSNITVENSFFVKNVASRDGGSLSANAISSITVGRSSFHNSRTGNNGGVISARLRSKISVGNSLFGSNIADSDGGVMYASNSGITIDNSFFDDNIAGHDGGVVYGTSTATENIGCTYFSPNARQTSISFKLSNCTFFTNSATEGGVVYMHDAHFTDFGSTYYGNIARNGGVVTVNEGVVEISACRFVNNTAESIGGVLYATSNDQIHHITLIGNTFDGNRATSGGVISLLSNDNLTVMESAFSYNSAVRGGIIHLLMQNKLTLKHSNFSHNSASSDGAVVYSADQNVLIVNNCTFNFNRAGNNGGVLCLLFQTELNITGQNCAFIGNRGHKGGVIYASKSTINAHCQALLLASNRAIGNGGAIYLLGANSVFSNEYNIIFGNVAMSGGAISGTDSQLEFYDHNCQLIGNEAEYGGAIHADESKLVLEALRFNMSTNVAVKHGGGLYVTMSELNIKGYDLNIAANRANGNGGGIHAANSLVIIEGVVHLLSNEAENGGAISLERNAKLQGKSDINDSINLTSNRANNYGGALYVDDKTNPETCVANQNDIASSKTECFIKSVFLNFVDNFAVFSGANLYGGLLDRCTVHTESYQNSTSNFKVTELLGIATFLSLSSINEMQLDTISSAPVRLCFCQDNQPNCSYQPEPIQVNRGMAFSLQLIAYNHILKPIRATIDIDSSATGKIAGKNIDKICTEIVLQFNFSTQVDSANLTLSVIGPCTAAEVAMKSRTIQFICSCPIGFQISSNDEILCQCVCDQVLQSYRNTECNPITESIIRGDDFWISYINHTWPNSSGYVIYPYCPFDYCYTSDKQVSINLNLHNGSDAQCDSNRIGVLCGTCELDYSVSLGSSKCLRCPAYWPGLLIIVIIVFIISGIGLVAFLLALNLTVAIGTLNAIIFYANIVAANKSALLPSGVSPASVFISWLNFDLGFDACFFDGMDTYIKTWLQLAFPMYIIILVVVIIQLSYYFTAFGRLVGKKDPVATLATLILLSYAKLLQTIITAFSYATLAYPDGSKKTLWLPDASIQYFIGKHVALFFIAILILLAGLIYTSLLFSWQWFLRFPTKRVKWIINQKVKSFIEIYFVPYTPNHRYWTGLLLLVRVSVYLVSAFNLSDDPRVTLSATIFILTSLVIYIATFGVRMYENCFINAMEILTYFNVIALSIFAWYTIDTNTDKTIVSNMSIGSTFIQLVAVIVYHTYKYNKNRKLFTIIHGFQSKICNKVMAKLIQKETNVADYNIPLVQPKPVEPTRSVVEIPTPDVLETEQQEEEEESKQDGINMIEENLTKSKQCSNKCSGIEISECVNSINLGTDMKHSCTILKERSLHKFPSNPQVTDVKEESMDSEMIQTYNKRQEISSISADNGQQERSWNGSTSITLEAEIHDH